MPNGAASKDAGSSKIGSIKTKEIRCMENLLAYQRALVIINPVSGQQDEGQLRQIIEDRLNAAQVSYEVRETEGENDAFRWAEQAASERFELVIVAGGDGTVM
jgi:diacylglycerol kinase family enzyme